MKLTITLDGPISPYAMEGITLSALRARVEDAKRDGKLQEVDLYLNSQGGSVFESFSIYNYLRSLRTEGVLVRVLITGLAASAATVIASAADEVLASELSQWMVHNAHTISMGNSKDHQNQAELLDKVDSQMYRAYAQRIGKQKAEELRQQADKDHWYTAAEAKEMGFVDRLYNTIDIPEDDTVLALYSPAGLAGVYCAGQPAANLIAPKPQTKTTPQPTNQTQPTTTMPENTDYSTLLSALNISATATPDQQKAALADYVDQYVTQAVAKARAEELRNVAQALGALPTVKATQAAFEALLGNGNLNEARGLLNLPSPDQSTTEPTSDLPTQGASIAAKLEQPQTSPQETEVALAREYHNLKDDTQALTSLEDRNPDRFARMAAAWQKHRKSL